MRTLALVLLLCSLAGSLTMASAAAQDDTGVTATVYQTANVRSGPDTRFEIVGQLTQGDTVFVTGRDESGRWLQVALESGEIGWLPLFVLTLDGSPDGLPVVTEETPGTTDAEAVTVVAYGRVNVRSVPALTGDLVGQLDVGDEATASARSNEFNDWLLISNDSVEGWVAFFTVRVQGDLESLPVLVPDSSGAELIPPSVLLRTRFNARLHTTATLSSPTILVVPFNSEVTPIARTADGEWLLVGFEGQTGWGITPLFEITAQQLEDIAVYNAATATPTGTMTAIPATAVPATPVPPTPTAGTPVSVTPDVTPEVTATAEAG